MTLADEMRNEWEQRHKRGQHQWQPGPLITVYEKPDDVVLVCACGAVRRVPVPKKGIASDDTLAAERIRAVADHQAECDQKIRDHGDAVRRATVEQIRAAVREIEDQYAAAPVFLAILDEVSK
jgi:hypothetical protein